MNESSRLSGSGIPKPTAAVKGTAKPTNSVAPMIVKPENDEKPTTNGIEEITDKKEEIEKPKPKPVRDFTNNWKKFLFHDLSIFFFLGIW